MKFNNNSNISEEDNIMDLNIYNIENRNSNDLIGDDIHNNFYYDSSEYYSENSIQSKNKSNPLTLVVSISKNLENIKGNT